jgi:hypothetical protein
METAGTEAQVLVFATKLNGDASCAPFAGLVTMIADAVVLHASRVNMAEKKSFIKYLK